jgi:outer membrane protein assembly factor BamE (lipoprotein component of BamABCDE complex)
MLPSRKLLPVLLAFSLSACASVQIGSSFDLRAFESKVERGVTTQAQVRGWLGTPTSTGVHVATDGERFEEWTYYHGAGRLPGMRDAEFKILQVRFDRNGIVRGYSWSGGP